MSGNRHCESAFSAYADDAAPSVGAKKTGAKPRLSRARQCSVELQLKTALKFAQSRYFHARIPGRRQARQPRSVGRRTEGGECCYDVARLSQGCRAASRFKLLIKTSFFYFLNLSFPFQGALSSARITALSSFPRSQTAAYNRKPCALERDAACADNLQRL